MGFKWVVVLGGAGGGVWYHRAHRGMPPIELVVRDALVFEHRQYIELAEHVGTAVPAHAQQGGRGACRCARTCCRTQPSGEFTTGSTPKRGGGLRRDRPPGVHLSLDRPTALAVARNVMAFLRSLPAAANPALVLVSCHEDLVSLGRLEPPWVYNPSMMSSRSARWRRETNTKQAAHVGAARSTSTDNAALEDLIDASLARGTCGQCDQLVALETTVLLQTVQPARDSEDQF